MGRKIIIIIAIAFFAVLAFRLSFTSAQRSGRESDFVTRDEFSILSDKVDKVLSMLPEKGGQEAVNREISSKLDQVLQNQQRIFADLDIIKVRASVKR